MDLIFKSIDSILIVVLAIFFIWKFVYEIRHEKRSAVILLLLLINIYFIVKVCGL
ncbi:hypothetical protein MOF08_10415 [Bacillus licheniformis]|uniref:hypothetical protein n=1 Tax=Bacillus licheniformis TaxID=1402 RepID=UPI00227E01B3|nr:hypothetical protein [Bacillus licheniformis]MCY9221128.1 hypothetical protein [Bacillus licheniformis]